MSYLGKYGHGQDVLELGSGAGLLLAVSAAVYRLQLPAERTRSVVGEDATALEERRNSRERDWVPARTQPGHTACA